MLATSNASGRIVCSEKRTGLCEGWASCWFLSESEHQGPWTEGAVESQYRGSSFFLADHFLKITRETLQAYGGRVVVEDVDADTVLVDPKFTGRDSLQRCYDASNDSRQRKIYIETTPFVQRCIRYGFHHTQPVRKGMGGQVGRK